MKNLSLTFNYTSNVPEDSIWVRLIQEDVGDDIASVEDTAELLDEVFHIEACAEENEPIDPETEDVEEAAEKVFDYSICSVDYDGNINVRVRVLRSHQDKPYRVYVTGGSILSTESITENLTTDIFVSSGTSSELIYPVVQDGGSFEWMSDLVATGDSAISRNGNVLYWKDEASGTIKATYATSYDVLNILVDGVDGEPGTATVRVVYQGVLDDLETEIPDSYDDDRSHCGFSSEVNENQTVTCYRTVVKTVKCSCSKEILSEDTYDEVVSCPDYAPTKCPGALTECQHFLGTFAEEEFVDCPEDNQLSGTGLINQVSDPDYYERVCCEVPAVPLPDCEVEILSYKGGKSIEPSEGYYKGLYGTATRFVPVTVEGGCGKHIIKQDIEAKSCCDSLPELVYDTASSIDTIDADDSGYVYVKDGLGPFTWRLISDRGYVWFEGSGSGTLTTDEETRWARIVSGEYPCGTYTVEVTDDCGTVVSGEIWSTYGEWGLARNYDSPFDDGSYEAKDLALPFADPIQYGFEDSENEEFSCHHSIWKYCRAAYVVIDEEVYPGDFRRVKYSQPMGLASIKGSSICKLAGQPCPTDPAAYGLAYDLSGDIDTYGHPNLPPGYQCICSSNVRYFSDGAGNNCLKAIYKMPILDVINMNDVWSEPSAFLGPVCINTEFIVDYSDSYVLTVVRSEAFGSDCSEPGEGEGWCQGTVYVTSYLNRVWRHTWSC